MSRGLANNGPQQARLRQRQKLKQKQYDADLQAIMNSPIGRRVVWRLIDDTSGFNSTCGVNDALALARAEGRRSVGARLWNEAMRVSPEESVLMYQEALRARAEEEVIRKDAEAEAKKDDEQEE